MSKKHDYTHPIYGDGIAPPEVIGKITLPPHWKRPQVRRFINHCRRAKVFYERDGHTIMLAFESEEEKDMNMGIFESQLKLNEVDYKLK